MTTKQPVSDAQQVRGEIGCLLQKHYPEFYNLTVVLPDDALEQVHRCLTLAPSAVFLSYCANAYRSSLERGAIVLRNVLLVLDDVLSAESLEKAQGGVRERSARVSLAVSVVADMEKRAVGGLHATPWDAGLASWVKAAALVALALPDLWNEATAKTRLLVYVALAGSRIRMDGLVELCRERGVIDAALVKAYLENDAAPLRVGVL